MRLVKNFTIWFHCLIPGLSLRGHGNFQREIEGYFMKFFFISSNKVKTAEFCIKKSYVRLSKDNFLNDKLAFSILFSSMLAKFPSSTSWSVWFSEFIWEVSSKNDHTKSTLKNTKLCSLNRQFFENLIFFNNIYIYYYII